MHIFPHWDFNEGQPIDVRVCSNAPRVELFLNGKSQGAFDIDHAHGQKLTSDHVIPYHKGELKALAYDENGAVIAEDVVRSFGDAVRLEAVPDKAELNADGEDLIYLEIAAYDENGTFCANADNRVNITVEGAGRLLGMDNGDSTDRDQYKGTSRRLFSGRLLAVIGAADRTGDIVVTLTSPGLPDNTVVLRAVPAEFVQGTSCIESAQSVPTECGRTDEIPVRKIELCADTLKLTPEQRETTVRTLILPANSDYADDIEYRVTNINGIITNIAECTVNADRTVTVRAKGDGEFWLRAMCKNGTDSCHLLSVLPFTAEGLGSAVTDPYEFVLF